MNMYLEPHPRQIWTGCTCPDKEAVMDCTAQKNVLAGRAEHGDNTYRTVMTNALRVNGKKA